MTDVERTDAERDADLAAAFLIPVSPERPELAAVIMGRVRRTDRRRRAVIATSGLAGAAIAGAAFASTGLLNSRTLGVAAEVASDPWTVAVLGLALIALAGTRYAVREI